MKNIESAWSGDNLCSGSAIFWLPSLEELREVPSDDCSTHCPRQTHKCVGTVLSGDL